MRIEEIVFRFCILNLDVKVRESKPVTNLDKFLSCSGSTNSQNGKVTMCFGIACSKLDFQNWQEVKTCARPTEEITLNKLF